MTSKETSRQCQCLLARIVLLDQRHSVIQVSYELISSLV